MTMSQTTSANVAWLTGQHSEPEPRSRPELVLVYDGAATEPEVIPGAVSMSDYSARSAAKPGRAAALEKARKKLASELGASPLAVLRMQAGLSQQEVAKRMEVTQPQIARCELGKHDPGTDTIARLAGALGLPIEIVFKAAHEGLKRRTK